ncbi:MAG TPA: PAS domain S-box protein [Anaerolineae bacterium]|nr:PAS domain S-box protein [Anaerolineae bacterium]HQI86279.1 PAS domain S-box protein [Anaerolineae bacterium]
MKKVQQFFQLTSRETDEARRRLLLRILLVCVGIADVVVLFFALYLDMANLETHALIQSLYETCLLLGAGIIFLYFISRFWSSRLAGALFALSLFSIITWSAGFELLLSGNVFLAFTIPILLASFLVYPWAGFIVAALTSMMITLGTTAVGEVVSLPGILGYFAVATIAWLSSWSLEQTLYELQLVNSELDQRVAARTAELTVINTQLQQEVAERERVTRALRESEARYRSLFASAPVGIGLGTRQGNLLAYNPELLRMMGYVSAPDLRNFDAPSVYANPVDRERLLQALYKDGYVKNYEIALKRQDGAIIDADLTVAPYSEDDPNVWQIVLVDITQRKQMAEALRQARDELELRVQERTAELSASNAALEAEIVERKRIEAALRESEARYRTLIEISPDSIVVCNLDGTITMWNQQSMVLYRASPSVTLLGKNVFDFVVPEDRERALAYTRETLEHGAVHNVEYACFRIDGSRYPGEISAAIIPDAEGKPVGFIGITRDITTRKKAEEVIKRHNQELQALNVIANALNQTHELEKLLNLVLPEILKVLGLDTGWIELLRTESAQVNPLVISQSGCSDPSLSGLIPATLREKVHHRIYVEGATVVLEDVQAEPWLRRNDAAQPLSFPVVVLPIKTQEHTTGMLGVAGVVNCRPRSFDAADIQLLTIISSQIGLAVENIRLFEETAEIAALRELDRLRSELVANFSHDLRTPLGLIKMSCTTLLRDDVEFDHQTQRELLEDIESQTDMLSDIINTMLDLARLESGQLQLNKQRIDLAQLTHAVVEAMKGRFVHHTVKSVFPAAPLLADVDPKYIAELLRNLIDNAIKYSPGGGEIVVAGEISGDHIVIRVSDHGIGIPQEALGKIFERFYRVDNDISRRISGVGLGLPLSQGIAMAHGGYIKVESALGQGSTFSLILPSSITHAQQSPAIVSEVC